MVKTGNKEESYNGYRIYLDIMTGGKLSSIRLLTWDSFIGQIDHPVGEKRWGYRYFSPLQVSLY